MEQTANKKWIHDRKSSAYDAGADANNDEILMMRRNDYHDYDDYDDYDVSWLWWLGWLGIVILTVIRLMTIVIIVIPSDLMIMRRIRSYNDYCDCYDD